MALVEGEKHRLARVASMKRATGLSDRGDARGGRLVNDAEDGQAGDRAGVLGGLALGVVEVCPRGKNCVSPTGKEREWDRRRREDEQAGTVTTAWVTFFPR
jgi:hypothetical protein